MKIFAFSSILMQTMILSFNHFTSSITAGNMKQTKHISGAFLQAIKTWLDQNNAFLSGADVCRATGLPSGTVYPLLHRMLERGWLERETEKGDPKILKRPLRKFYRLTPDGHEKGQKLLEKYGPRLPNQAPPQTETNSSQPLDPITAI